MEDYQQIKKTTTMLFYGCTDTLWQGKKNYNCCCDGRRVLFWLKQNSFKTVSKLFCYSFVSVSFQLCVQFKSSCWNPTETKMRRIVMDSDANCSESSRIAKSLKPRWKKTHFVLTHESMASAVMDSWTSLSDITCRLYTWGEVVNDANIITRRHVGGMLRVNKEWVKMWKYKKYAQTVNFDCCNSTHNSLQAHIRLRSHIAAAWYTSTMFTIADIMTSL